MVSPSDPTAIRSVIAGLAAYWDTKNSVIEAMTASEAINSFCEAVIFANCSWICVMMLRSCCMRCWPPALVGAILAPG